MISFADLVIHILVPLMVLMFLIIISILLINRAIYQMRLFRRRLTKAKIDQFLASLIFIVFDEVSFEIEINKFKKRIPFKKNWCKAIILDEIINLKQNIKGESSKNIHFIYEKFDLFKYTQRFLKRKEWFIKSLGIYQLQALEYSKGEDLIVPFLDNKNEILSTNAYMALISLSPKGLNYLSDFPHKINLTTEIKIMDILHTYKLQMPKNMDTWLRSDNPSIIKLGIKFMVYYNNNNFATQIIHLLNSPIPSIRYEVIAATKDLYIEDAETILIEQFAQEELSNQIEILNTLGQIGGEETKTFIINTLPVLVNLDLKLAAVYALNRIDDGYFDNHFKDDTIIQKMTQQYRNPYIL